MIKVISDGRLGNQMFHYAFAIATAKKLRTKVQIQMTSHEDEVVRLFEVPPALFQLKASKADRWIFEQRGKLRLNKSFVEDLNLYSTDLKDNTTYIGYFQNERYFESVQGLIKSTFQLKQKWNEEFDKIKSTFDFENSIVIHARLRDFLKWGNDELGGIDLSLPSSYYINAIKQLKASFETPIILVSDDTALAIERLSFLKNISVLNSSPEISFQALLNAKRLIISNSTFAWWGAWLNPHKPQVIGPEHWLGFKVGKEYPQGISSASFSQIPVF